VFPFHNISPFDPHAAFVTLQRLRAERDVWMAARDSYIGRALTSRTAASEQVRSRRK